MSEELQQRARAIGERLNSKRQKWEITLANDPEREALLAEMNALAGMFAELLHVLGYGEAEGGDRRE